MPEYLAPGVYVEEVDAGPKPIEGVSTSTAGFVGVTQKGPSTGLPELVTSYGDFERKFGGYVTDPALAAHSYLPHAVEGFFANGGRRVYIARVTGAGAAQTRFTTDGGARTRLREDMGSSAMKILRVESLRGIDTTVKVTLREVKAGVTRTSGPHDVAKYDRPNREIELATAATGAPFEARYTTVETDATRSSGLVLRAADSGKWGDDLVLESRMSSAAGADVAAVIDATHVKLTTTAGFYPLAWVEFDTGRTKRLAQVTAVEGDVVTLAADPGSLTPEPNTGGNKTTAATCEWDLTATFGERTERHTGLTIENVPGRFYLDRLLADSSLVVPDTPAPTATRPARFPTGADGLRIALTTAGNNGAAPNADAYRGADAGPGLRTGIQALADIDQVSIVAVPGQTAQSVQGALINHCELLLDRIAVLDSDDGLTPAQVQVQRRNFDTKYAALYYPWLTVPDPVTGADKIVPPSGHVVGIYARSDNERGVHKPPANEVIRGITGLEVVVNQREQDILNPLPNNINVLRDFRDRGRGYRVWGARCITSDPAWKYVNVRRLFLYLEESLEEGTQWVVFEPNDERLWARVTQTVENFLTRVWRDGALMGTKPAEAFFVECDRRTMSQDDIDNGRLIMRIGVAPVKPAEYVIVRISQWAGGSAVSEG